MNAWQIGDIRVERIMEFEKPLLSPAQLLPASTPEEVEQHRSWLVPHLMDPESGILILAMHSFLIRSSRGNILVDTCSGNHKPRPGKLRYHMNSWPYLERLGEIGIHPDEIDFVLCTHLHVDHVGWNTMLVDGRWVPTFRNAKYLFGRREWEFWKSHYRTPEFTGDLYYLDSILPVIEAGQAHFIESDYSFDDNIWVEPSPGHTPGHICVHIRAGDLEAIFTGDIMHHALQCAEPHWSSCFCVDERASHHTRRAFLEQYADTSALIMPAHFPTPSVGRIASASKAFRFVFDSGS